MGDTLQSLIDPNNVKKVTVSQHVGLHSVLYQNLQDDFSLKGLQQQQISITRVKTVLSSLLDCWLLDLSEMEVNCKISLVFRQQM